MARQATGKGHLDYRDATRMRIALDLMGGDTIRASDLERRYYQGIAKSSIHKTFKRDRDALAAEGIYLTEEAEGTAKSWRLDTRRSLASLAPSADEDARVVAEILAPLANRMGEDGAATLAQATARIGRGSGTDGTPDSQDLSCDRKVLATVVAAWRSRKPCNLMYQSLQDEAGRARTLYTYGMFELNASVYAVGLRRAEGSPDAIRTLNLARVASAEVDEAATPYVIPSDFSISSYRLLPFEIGDEQPYEATMYIPRAAAGVFKEEARQRGSKRTHQGGSVTWTVWVRDTARAAAWAAGVGALPEQPEHLVDAWESLLKGAVEHER